MALPGDMEGVDKLLERGGWTALTFTGTLLFGCYAGIDVEQQSSDTDVTDASTGDTHGEPTDGHDDDSGGAELACDEGGPRLGSSHAGRLTRAEYENTVFDLLGLQGSWAANFPPDGKVGPFDENAAAPPSQLALDAYMTAAAEIAETATAALSDPAALPTWLPCVADELGTDACAQRFVQRFGRRAFRRPLTSDEETAFLDLFAAGRERDGFTHGISLTLQALLQSPQFLYRLELGDGAGPTEDGALLRLTGHELATRLSYFLIESTPDDELLDAADAGQLDDAEDVEAQIRRLLQHPRARRTAARFVTQWVGVERLDAIFKDPEIFPQFETLRASMVRETELFVEHLVFDREGGLADLFTTPSSFADDGLAAMYGVTIDPAAVPDEEGFYEIELDPTQRAGLLTQAGFLSAHAHPGETSIVLRGVSVLDDILCAPPPPPPADIDTDETTVDRTVAPCVSCHMLIDPIGSGFEHYDAIGSYRLEDEEGEAIDASGELVVSDVDGPFYGAVELGQQLAQSDSVRQCFTRQWFRFALQRMDRTDDDCVLETLSESWSTNEEPIVELMVALANSPAMRYRQVPLPEEE